LHYDLRLEMGGALASWAIPKGPSYDPAEKRLAVQTEDHPLAYASFEGRIPEGEYGAGDSIVWDQGTWETEPPGQGLEQRERGRMTFRLSGEKLQGLWHLVRTRPARGKQQWLFFKARDELASADGEIVERRPESVRSGKQVTRGPVSARTLRAPHPEPIDLLVRIWPPMLATLSTVESMGGGPWILEVKYDGFRAIAGLAGGRVALQSRRALDLSARFPEVSRALAGLRVGEAVVDGEIVAYDRKRISKFELLQEGRVRPRYVAFDLLWLEGEDLRDRPLEQRRDLLQSVLAGAEGPIELAERAPEESVSEAFTWARRRNLEGFVAKRRGSPYRGGRSRDWLKVKLRMTQEVVLIGYAPISTGTKEIGALLTAVHERGGFRYSGKVGTGFSAKQRRALFELLEADRIEAPPASGAPRDRYARWCRPKHVAQVELTEWTRDGMLRQSSFQGLRTDKVPEEVEREVPER
jgi:bifunctional non-homologous end joining protein LigD